MLIGKKEDLPTDFLSATGWRLLWTTLANRVCQSVCGALPVWLSTVALLLLSACPSASVSEDLASVPFLSSLQRRMGWERAQNWEGDTVGRAMECGRSFPK